jgi:hypothetical protein
VRVSWSYLYITVEELLVKIFPTDILSINQMSDFQANKWLVKIYLL